MMRSKCRRLRRVSNLKWNEEFVFVNIYGHRPFVQHKQRNSSHPTSELDSPNKMPRVGFIRFEPHTRSNLVSAGNCHLDRVPSKNVNNCGDGHDSLDNLRHNNTHGVRVPVRCESTRKLMVRNHIGALIMLSG